MHFELKIHGCFYHRFVAPTAPLTWMQSPAHVTGTFIYCYQRGLASWFVAIVYYCLSCWIFFTASPLFYDSTPNLIVRGIVVDKNSDNFYRSCQTNKYVNLMKNVQVFEKNPDFPVILSKKQYFIIYFGVKSIFRG